MAAFPRGVAHIPHAPNRPYQARVWWQGRRWSLGYYATISEAAAAVTACYQEIERWAAMSLPPPMLALQHQERLARQATPSDRDPAP